MHRHACGTILQHKSDRRVKPKLKENKICTIFNLFYFYFIFFNLHYNKTAILIATADLKKTMLSLNGTPMLSTQFVLSSCLPSFFEKKKKKSCSASAVSALGGDSCPSVPYKAPHLGAWSQSQHMELWNSCQNRIEGRVHSSFTAAQWCNDAALQPPSCVLCSISIPNFTSAIFTSATQHAALNDRW